MIYFAYAALAAVNSRPLKLRVQFFCCVWALAGQRVDKSAVSLANYVGVTARAFSILLFNYIQRRFQKCVRFLVICTLRPLFFQLRARGVSINFNYASHNWKLCHSAAIQYQLFLLCAISAAFKRTASSLLPARPTPAGWFLRRKSRSAHTHCLISSSSQQFSLPSVRRIACLVKQVSLFRFPHVTFQLFVT